MAMAGQGRSPRSMVLSVLAAGQGDDHGVDLRSGEAWLANRVIVVVHAIVCRHRIHGRQGIRHIRDRGDVVVPGRVGEE